MALADRQGSGFGSGDRGPIRAGRLAWHWIGALRHNGVGSGVGREESGEMGERGLTLLLLAIAIMAFLGQGLGILIIALVSQRWIPYCRIARGQTLSLRTRDFVEAARAAAGDG